MKKLARKLASLIVTYYYGRIYKKAVKNAEEQHAKNGEMYYVVDHLVKGQTLTVLNRAMFRKMKRDAMKPWVPNHEMYQSNEYTIAILKEGAWYHTADRSGNNGLSAKDIEARRLFFIKVGLVRAKLLDKVVDAEK